MTQPAPPSRDVVFISHANPEDNVFARWLTLRLRVEGYRAWCDLTALLGGEDFWKDIEGTIRQRTRVFVYVLSRSSNAKPGPLKELAVAEQVARASGLSSFIVPVRVDDLPPSEFNISLTRLNALDCRVSWAQGLADLIKSLTELGIAREPTHQGTARAWWADQFEAGLVVPTPETLIANCFPIEPITLYLHELSRRSGLGELTTPEQFPWPAVRFKHYLATFCPAAAIADHVGPVCRITGSIADTVGGATAGAGLRQIWRFGEERQTVSHLLRRTWDGFVKARQYPIHRFANNRHAMHFTDGLVPGNWLHVSQGPYGSIRRRVSGQRQHRPRLDAEPTYTHWHFSVDARPTDRPVLGYFLRPHVLFSDDGSRIWESPDRLHRYRRSMCRDWWNDRWRDLVLGSMRWFANDTDTLTIPVGPELALCVSTSPVAYTSPVSLREDLIGAEEPIGIAPTLEDDDGSSDESRADASDGG